MKHIQMRKRQTCWLILVVVLLGISPLLLSCGSGQAVESRAAQNVDLASLQVPDGFTIEQAVAPDLLSFPMFASFDHQGRLFVFESNGETTSTEEMLKNPPYHIRLLEDSDGDGIYDKSNIYADAITFPMGGTFYQGSLYVAASPDLLRFTDTNGDGVADKREVILTGWTLNHNAAILSGPFIGPDGWLYMADARRGFEIKTREGNVLKGKGARIWRCRPDGSGLETVSGGGFDNSIELIFMPSGETIGTMTYFTDPQGGFRDALMHWVEGGVYPKPQQVIEEDQLKLTGDLMPVMTTLPRVAPSGLMRYRGSMFGQQFQGNLFSAQFNTGRVMRHVITPKGATFHTEDAPFMTSTSSDVHPTDVLQDADGSLLVVNTGGWFIAGCPLSRVAKPDIRGGIYRIWKVDAPVIEDPWGLALHFKEMSPEDLVQYIADPRPAVSDRAIEQLITTGKTAVEPLKKVLLSSEDEQVRTAIVFALYRIHMSAGTEEVLTALRAALHDESVVVRTAAARVLGMAKDKQAVDKLMEVVQEDQAPVRRQAATALGQIGDDRAVSALLNASADADDRFVEHAIIYSLITLDNTTPLVDALDHPSAHVQKAALIALDQMDGSPLRKDHLVPFLESKDAQLRNTGIWVASHHPDWSDIVIDFLKTRLGVTTLGGTTLGGNPLNATELSETETASVTELMITFSEDAQLQNFVASQLGNAATPVEKKSLLMEVIARSPVEELPAAWVRQLSHLLQGEDARMRSQVLDLIEVRGITALDEELEQMIQHPETPVDFRLKALSARIMSGPQLSEAEFRMLLNYLGPEHASPVRQLAVRLLVQAELSDAQLLTIAQEQLGQADLFLLPGLVHAFQGSSNPEVGEALVTTLLTTTDRLDNLSVQDLQALLETFPPSVQKSAEPLLKTLQEQQAGRLTRLQKLEAALQGGDVGEGRKLFFGKAVCSSCHAIGADGGDFGPDLTNIGDIRSRHDLLEAILYPNASFAREHETFRVVTKTNAYTGIITEELPEAIIVAVGPGPRVRVPRAEITSIEPQNVSMMPPGLDQQLNTGELADLLAFLTSLPDGLAFH